jgi:protein-S-isoprenylcysteine O-methyltransferase Ste14
MRNFYLFLGLSIATHVIRTGYELLKFRNIINPGNKIVFGLIFTNMAILWISWFALCLTDSGKVIFSPVLKYAGACITLAGLFLFVFSLAKIKRFENYHGKLITSGVYKYVRHPMYLGFICWIVGMALYSQSWVAMLLTVFYTGNIVLWKKLEEIQLKIDYPEYKDYMQRTYF